MYRLSRRTKGNYFLAFFYAVLATLAFGIGHLWLAPYKQAANAAFYREVSGTEFVAEQNSI